ncbi:hypothetical protein PUH89_16480 [Rhodobacter capsulatus]|uniref:hypothetical protein n=1 Tax=Rhodobacter capsulatus TaxID=1061 RepID=UPI00094206C8|nr:hypothetical protein [Rhodobacter capsulatus]WER08883.1 hypothetical protein PUH89_16480 [Rhodobacter capsulatus]
MAGRPALVSQAELKRTVSAALAAGLRIGRVEVDRRTGIVTVYSEGPATEAKANPCDRLLK